MSDFEVLRAKTEWQGAVIPDFHTVVEHGDADRAARMGVVAVAEGIDDGFAQGRDGDQQFFDPLQAMILKAAADWKMAMQECHRLVQQVKGVALMLAVVDELVFIGAFEAGQPEGALWIMKRGFGPEKDDRRIQQAAVNTQVETVEDLRNVGAGGFGQTPGFDTKAHGAQNLVSVEIGNGDCVSGHRFPAVPGMHVLEDSFLIACSRQHGGRRADAVIGPAVESEGALTRQSRSYQHQHFATARKQNPLLSHCRRRLKMRQHGGHLAQGGIRDRLADDPALGGDPDENPAAIGIEERAEGLTGTGELGGGLFEFHRLTFTGGDDGL